MAQKLLSISLGTTSAKLAEISQSGKKVNVFSAYDIPLPEGLCEDGVILDVEALAEELKAYISKFRIKEKDLAFSIASKRIASKEVLIPFVKEKQIKGIIEINASEYFPVANISDYVLNYSIVETVVTAENKQYRVNVTATPNEILLGYSELAKAMKCSVSIIDYAGNAILQVLKSQIEPGAINAILQLGYENTVINVMNGSVQIMQRTVATGLNALISVVAECVGLNESDAVAFLEDNDISRIAGAYPDVKYVVDSLLTSIGRIFDFYNGRAGEHTITGVKFIGDATYVNGIGEALEAGLGYPTEEIFTLNNVSVKNRYVTPEFATNFIANIGVVIAPMNLEYKSDDEEAKAKKEGKLPWGLVVVSFIASSALIGTSLLMYINVKNEYDNLKRQYESLSQFEEFEARLTTAQEKTNVLENLYNATKGSGDSLAILVSDLEKKMPAGMSINTFTLSDGVVTITATASGKESVARLIQEVGSLDYVSNVEVEYVGETLDGVAIIDTFNMSFNLLTKPENTGAEEGDVIVIDGNTQETGGEQ